MKKVLCIIICLLLLGGCGKDKITDVEKEPLVISGFSAAVCTKLNDVEISADVKYAIHGELELTVTSPETLKGTVITCKDGECEIAYDGISFTLPDGELPNSMICTALEDCLNNVLGKTPTENEDGFFVYTYELDGCVCQLFTDSQKRFVKLDANGERLLTFSRFDYITD